jgi:hypothetical protein
MVTSAHRVEVEVGGDGHASAPPAGAAAAAPPAGADKFLTSHAFITSTCDPGVYLHWSSSHNVILLGIILVYVDDLIVFPSSDAWMNSLRDMIRSTFDITDEGICTWVQGMGIDHNLDGSIALHQEKNIQDML